MKRRENYLLYTLDFIVLGIMLINFGSYKLSETVYFITNLNSEKKLESTLLGYDDNKGENELYQEEQQLENENIQEVVQEEIIPKVEDKVEVEIPKEEPVIDVVPTDTVPVLEVLTGKMSGYGPDCYGCTSNSTASGQYVGEGNIYYNDATYGTVRIVSADRKYPFGTIVRITNTNVSQEPILAVVLDRGGAIGIGRTFLFDLLYATEYEASLDGVSSNATFEILRFGY